MFTIQKSGISTPPNSETNSIIVPAQLGDLGGIIAGAMAICGKISETQAKTQKELGRHLEEG